MVEFFSKKKKEILIILFGILVIWSLNFYQKSVRNFFYLISAPFQRSFWMAGDKASDFFETITKFKNLKKENESFESKIREILAENVSLVELKKENETLREALKIGLEKEFKFSLVRVMGKDASQDFLLIDKGLKDGVSKDMPVINKEKMLVGKTSEIYENFSKVMLASNKESSFGGKISDKEIFGVVQGTGNFKILFGLVPQDNELKKGDSLITTVIGGIFPAGLLVGKIEEIDKTDIEPFQQAKVSPFYDIKELDYLFLISEF